MKKRRIKRTILNFILISGILILAFLIWMLVASETVIKTVRVEAGTEINPRLFSSVSCNDISYARTVQAFYPDTPGIYDVKIQKGIFRFDCKLIIEDNMAPQARGIELSLPYGKEVTPYDFVTDVYDATEITALYVIPPNMTRLGSQPVSVKLIDSVGNETTVTSDLTVLPIVPVAVLQAGDEPITAESLVCYGNYEGVTEDFDNIDFEHPGDYYVYLFVDEKSYPCHISVIDDKYPEIAVNEIHFTTGIERTDEDYLQFVTDNTPVKLELTNIPDYMNEGITYLTMSVTDEGGNVTSRNMRVVVEADTEAPVFVEANNFSAFRDEALAYRKYINVEDNSGVDVTIDIDSTKVDASVVGEYPVIYTATDYAGNSTTKEIKVSIVERTYTDEDLYARIDELLAKIITDDMDERAKARAIYDWTKNNIEYTGTSDKNNFNKAAINGLLDFKGDCYTNTTICVACFQRLGMKAKVIKKDPIVTMFNHWWLIVNVDGNYYHMDTCPRTKDNPEMFLWTDYELKTYSARHLETHNYDRSKYPHVKYY